MAYMVKTQNELIGSVFAEDYLEDGVNLSKNHSMTLLSYDYQIVRSRDNTGTPYGEPACIEARFVIDVANKRACNIFYQRLQSNQPESITFVFNAKFDPVTDFLSSFSSCFVARCYIVDLEEMYDVERSNGKSGKGEQMSIAIKVLMTKITYVGSNDNNLTLRISE